MRGLNQFEGFDFTRFCQGKKFVTTASKAWVDYGTKQKLGTVVTVAITEDQTEYKAGKDGKAISNLFEKMNWKIAQVFISQVMIGHDRIALVLFHAEYWHGFPLLSVSGHEKSGVLSPPQGIRTPLMR